jgi:hypothetical protein
MHSHMLCFKLLITIQRAMLTDRGLTVRSSWLSEALRRHSGILSIHKYNKLNNFVTKENKNINYKDVAVP